MINETTEKINVHGSVVQIGITEKTRTSLEQSFELKSADDSVGDKPEDDSINVTIDTHQQEALAKFIEKIKLQEQQVIYLQNNNRELKIEFSELTLLAEYLYTQLIELQPHIYQYLSEPIQESIRTYLQIKLLNSKQLDEQDRAILQKLEEELPATIVKNVSDKIAGVEIQQILEILGQPKNQSTFDTELAFKPIEISDDLIEKSQHELMQKFANCFFVYFAKMVDKNVVISQLATINNTDYDYDKILSKFVNLQDIIEKGITANHWVSIRDLFNNNYLEFKLCLKLIIQKDWVSKTKSVITNLNDYQRQQFSQYISTDSVTNFLLKHKWLELTEPTLIDKTLKQT